VAVLLATVAIVSGIDCTTEEFRDSTLKTVLSQPVHSLLYNLDGHKSFEASSITVVNDTMYIALDNLWSIASIQSFSNLDARNRLIKRQNPHTDGDSSQFEALFESDGFFYLVRESINNTATGLWQALIEKAVFGETEYKVVEECFSEQSFQTDNKGFEGAFPVKNAKGELFVLGLCEGNHCKAGKDGADKGNGKVVVMKRNVTSDGRCYWQTVRKMDVPSNADFEDFSAITIEQKEWKVAISSQASGLVWIGKMSTDANGFFDENNSKLTGGSIYNFNPNAQCELQFCNVEGLHWRDEATLYSASDKMKADQGFQCLQNDQSVHLFAIP
jgi:hypothetical protein